jgi:hypothetical protein
MYYKLRSKAIIYELLDCEIILADLDTGNYFSIRGSGITIWQLLIAGHTVVEIESLFQKKYPTDSLETIRSLIDPWLKEQLLVATDLPLEQRADPIHWLEAFEPPVFEKYEEMKNLLMLDPIHEVDEQGWPVIKESDASSTL